MLQLLEACIPSPPFICYFPHPFDPPGASGHLSTRLILYTYRLLKFKNSLIYHVGCAPFNSYLTLLMIISLVVMELVRGFPGGAGSKELTCQCRRHKGHGFNPWVRKINLEKEMTIHSSILAWRIPWTEEPGGLQSTRSRRVGHY